MKLHQIVCDICREEFISHLSASRLWAWGSVICGECEIELAEWRDADLVDLREYAAAILPDPF